MFIEFMCLSSLLFLVLLRINLRQVQRQRFGILVPLGPIGVLGASGD